MAASTASQSAGCKGERVVARESLELPPLAQVEGEVVGRLTVQPLDLSQAAAPPEREARERTGTHRELAALQLQVVVLGLGGVVVSPRARRERAQEACLTASMR